MIEIIITGIIVGVMMTIAGLTKILKNVPDSECVANSNCCNFKIIEVDVETEHS